MTTRTHPPQGESGLRRSGRIVLTVTLALIGIALVGLGLTMGFQGVPPTVAEITVANPTDYAVRVLVAGEEESWLPLGTVEPDDEATFEQVIDQGPTWRIRFDHTGETVEELTFDRAELEEQRWHLEIPLSVQEALSEAGVPPSVSPTPSGNG